LSDALMVIGGKSYEKYEFTSASKAILNEVIQKVKKFVDNVLIIIKIVCKFFRRKTKCKII